MKVLTFDVETTGLLPKNASSLEECPHIVQLSFAVYDTDNKIVIHKYDSYVKLDDNATYSEQAEKITGITRSMLKRRGKDVLIPIQKLHAAYSYCDVVVGHNLDFDKKMVLIEMKRNEEQLRTKSPEVLRLFDPEYEKAKKIQTYCTMKNGIDICNIEVPSKNPDKKPHKKWPKLIELNNVLFPGENVSGLHNSMIDVLVCLKCYIKMKHDYIDNQLGI
jgi:DNA polymerase III epsilon subunit-like protein